jgi:drug/metabolite transporter (DMT)-like permease
MHESLSYLAYLAISIGLTIWVARTLSKNGEVFLIDCFGHDEVLARSTNHLLVVGFYLVNLGFILLALQFGKPPETLPEAIRYLSGKVGVAVLVLGAMHFFNMNAIAKFGRKVGAWFREEQWAAQARPAAPEA